MGYFRHHAIVVTGYYPDEAEAAHAAAIDAGCISVSTPLTAVNGQTSFAVLPDGGKEYSAISDEGNEARDLFIDWLRVDDRCSWVEVLFGRDDGDSPSITRASDLDEP